MSHRPRSAAFALWTLVVLLAILHQDLWLWDDQTLVFGFMPIGLLYHAGFSIVCAAVWGLAVVFAWPRHIEEWANEGDDADGAAS